MCRRDQVRAAKDSYYAGEHENFTKELAKMQSSILERAKKGYFITEFNVLPLDQKVIERLKHYFDSNNYGVKFDKGFDQRV